MRIELTAISKFQRYFPSRTSEIDFPGTNLSEFLNWVKERYGLDTGAHRNIKISHNSIVVEKFDIPLRDGDRISFIPIVAGG